MILFFKFVWYIVCDFFSFNLQIYVIFLNQWFYKINILDNLILILFWSCFEIQDKEYNIKYRYLLVFQP